MGVSGGPKIITDGLVLDVDAANYKSFRGVPATNTLPSPTINAFPTASNGWGTYNTNQYNSNTYFSIGTISSVTSNIVTTSGNHPLRSYDVVTPQTTGGGVTAGTNYLVKKISDTQFSLHDYNSSQDGSQGYVNPSTGNYKVYDTFANDTRVSINSTSFPTMWWGPPHLPNSGLVKELIGNGFSNIIPGVNSSCIRLHFHRTDDVKDGMAYSVDASTTPSIPHTVSFYTRSPDERAVGKGISYQIYNYTGGSATYYSMGFTLGPVGIWQRQTFTFTPNYANMISYWFSTSNGVYSWDWACMQVETGSAATPFVPGTRGATVSTGGGVSDLTGLGNDGEFVNKLQFDSSSGGALVFNGTDAHIKIPEISALNTQTPTVEVWVKTDATSQNGFWFEKGNVNTQYALFQEGANITWRHTTNVSSLTAPCASYMNTSQYAQVVGTYTSGTRRIYVNGIQVASDSLAYTLPTNANGSSIGVYGGFNGGRGYYYDGNIAIVRVYNKALSPAEVLQNFNATRSRFGI